jgi:hypothetical protein
MRKGNDFHPLLKRIARIARMERGTLCRMAGRPHYNHQTWQDGRNVSRYVRSEDVAALQEAIEGYRQFRRLAEQYADAIIRRTRAERAQSAPAKKRSTRPREYPPKDV